MLRTEAVREIRHVLDSQPHLFKWRPQDLRIWRSGPHICQKALPCLFAFFSIQQVIRSDGRRPAMPRFDLPDWRAKHQLMC